MDPITLQFEPEKETKGTWKFAELLPTQFAEAKVGSLYVRKSTLGELGYAEGKNLEVTLAVAS